MKYRKIVISILAVLLIFSGCHTQKVKEYRLPAEAQWFIGKESYDDIAETAASSDSADYNLNKKYGTAASLDDRYMILTATDSQKDAVIDNNLELAREAAFRYSNRSDKNSVDWSDDFSTITYDFYYPDCISSDIKKAADLMGHFTRLNQLIHINRILTTGDCDSPVKVILKNPESHHILSYAMLPYEPVVASEEDWFNSFSADIEESSNFAGYSKVKMSVEEVLDDRIIFSPAGENFLYPNDDSLCLWLDNVEENSIQLPYNINPKDTFILRVDGSYDAHDDGDSIPDISPKAVIPEKYLSDSE